MTLAPLLLWFRLDLRLQNNPALQAALQTGRPIIPVYLWAPEEEAPWAPGAASRVWLHFSLKELATRLAELGYPMIFRSGTSLENLQQLIQETGAEAVFWNRRYEPKIIERDTLIKANLQSQGVQVQTFNSHLLYEPWELHPQKGLAYKVFTPFWQALVAKPLNPLWSEVRLRSTRQASKIFSLNLDELRLLPTISWDQGIREHWRPGEIGAQETLQNFLKAPWMHYRKNRDFPAESGTSRLSPHLHFGEISVPYLWHQVHAQSKQDTTPALKEEKIAFLREVAWREFAYHLLYHFPHTPEAPLRSEFENFPWKNNPEEFVRWKQGCTGFPLVDAGMRELWHTGWMHNRARMVVASFLVKDLRLPWQLGARWFWDTLVDADLANNTLGWQWSAGCGADAAPYFRIFNPESQATKFDPQGDYQYRWIPELKKDALRSPRNHLTSAKEFRDYPDPMVDHAQARHEALLAFQTLKKT